MGRDQELKWLAFSLYPLSFFLYCPFNQWICYEGVVSVVYVSEYLEVVLMRIMDLE